jgi:hypothetical protein
MKAFALCSTSYPAREGAVAQPGMHDARCTMHRKSSRDSSKPQKSWPTPRGPAGFAAVGNLTGWAWPVSFLPHKAQELVRGCSQQPGALGRGKKDRPERQPTTYLQCHRGHTVVVPIIGMPRAPLPSTLTHAETELSVPEAA